MQILIAATLFIGALAAPYPAGMANKIVTRHTCPAGLIPSYPLCCTSSMLGLASLDCNSVPDGGCKGASKPNCCSRGLAGQGLLCNQL